MGYPKNKKGYKIYLPSTEKWLETTHVRFDERVFFKLPNGYMFGPKTNKAGPEPIFKGNFEWTTKTDGTSGIVWEHFPEKPPVAAGNEDSDGYQTADEDVPIEPEGDDDIENDNFFDNDKVDKNSKAQMKETENNDNEERDEDDNEERNDDDNEKRNKDDNDKRYDTENEQRNDVDNEQRNEEENDNRNDYDNKDRIDNRIRHIMKN
jgi:hypothetical protein